MKNIQFDLNSANSQLEIVTLERDEFEKQVNKSHEEVRLARDHANKEIEAKNEELEDVKYGELLFDAILRILFLFSKLDAN